MTDRSYRGIPQRIDRPTAAAAQENTVRTHALAAIRRGDLEEAQRLVDADHGQSLTLAQAFRLYQIEIETQAAQLRESQRRTEQNLEWFIHLFRALPAAAVQIDAQGAVVEANEAALDTLGLRQLDRAQPLPLRRLMATADGELRLTAMMAAAADGSVQAADDLALRTIDGSLRWADLRITRLPALTDAALEHPRQARFLCVFNDRTAHVEADRAHAIVEAAQHQRDVDLATIQAKGQLLSRLSHELRTPLNAVLGFSQLLLAPDGGLSLQSLDRVQHIRRAGEHLLALVDEVLEINRAESGQVPPVREPVRLSEVAQDVLALQRPAADLQSITLVLERDSDPGVAPTALADPRRVREVLINLVNNAIKYNVHHGWVTVRLGSDARHVWVEIDDGGIGMSEQQLEHLYEPFNRLGAERLSIEGTGLGLSIAHAMVLGMGGQLNIRSRPGAGTCCRVSLPPAPRNA